MRESFYDLEEVGRADLGRAGRLVLLAPSHDCYPGEVIQGVVQLSLHEPPLLLRGVRVKFTGMNRVVLPNDGATVHSSQSHDGRGVVDLLRDEEHYENGGVTEILVGLGDETNDNREGDLLEFNEEYYGWTFSFKVPENAPMSYCDDHFEVVYSIATMIDSPMVPLVTSVINHSIVVGSLKPIIGLTHSRGLADTFRSGSNDVAREDDNNNVVDDQLYSSLDSCSRSLGTQYEGAGVANALPTIHFLKNYFGYGSRPVDARDSNRLSLQLLNLAALTFIDVNHEVPVKVRFPKPKSFRYIKVRLSLNIEVVTRHFTHVPFSNEAGLGKLSDRYIRGFVKKLFKRSRDSVDNLYDDSADRCRTNIWKSEKTVDVNGHDGAPYYMEELFVLPLIIDTATRQRALRAWPQPEPLVNDVGSQARVQTISITSPLGITRYKLQCDVIGHTRKKYSLFKRQQRREKTEAKILYTDEIEVPIEAPRRTVSDQSTESYDGQTAPHLPKSISRESGHVDSINHDIQRRSSKTYTTPHAKAAPIRVVGEMMHRGSAAVLVDRGGRVRPSCSTPECYAPLTRISNHHVACNSSIPSFSPALAYVYDHTSLNALHTPHVGTISSHEESSTKDEISHASQDCSPVTTLEPCSSPDSTVTEQDGVFPLNARDNTTQTITHDVMVQKITELRHEYDQIINWLQYALHNKQLCCLENPQHCVDLLVALEGDTAREHLLLWMIRNRLLIEIEDILFGSDGIIGRCFQLQHVIERISSHARNEILMR